MKMISHRGNVRGMIKESENNPTYINAAISDGYDVEIDVWKNERHSMQNVGRICEAEQGERLWNM